MDSSSLDPTAPVQPSQFAPVPLSPLKANTVFRNSVNYSFKVCIIVLRFKHSFCTPVSVC